MDELTPTLSTAPFIQRRLVEWGDCDPAGIIYTPRVLEYVLIAIDAWQRQVLGHDWFRLSTEHDLGMPTVRSELDFMHVFRPGDYLDLELRVAALGRSSIDFGVAAALVEGPEAFFCRQVSVFVERNPYRAIPWRDDMRAKIEAYMAACKD